MGTSDSETFKVVYDAGESSGQARAIVGSVHEDGHWLIVEWGASGLVRIPLSRVYFVARQARAVGRGDGDER